MVRKPKTAVTKPQNGDFAPLIAEVRQLIAAARNTAASAVNTLQVLTNFEIGRRIVEHEQQGKRRAEYGTALLKALSAELTWEFGQGFSERNLISMRRFYLVWRDRVPQISQQPAAKLDCTKNPRRAAENPPSARISQQAAAKFDSDQNPRKADGNPSSAQIVQQLVAQSDFPFKLSWTHYVTLLTIQDPDERSFYEIEAADQDWSVPELRRQKASSLYERLALSRDKGSIRQLAAEGQIVTKPEDILREPYVLEFLGIDEKASYSESDMETAIIDHFDKMTRGQGDKRTRGQDDKNVDTIDNYSLFILRLRRPIRAMCHRRLIIPPHRPRLAVAKLGQGGGERVFGHPVEGSGAGG